MNESRARTLRLRLRALKNFTLHSSPFTGRRPALAERPIGPNIRTSTKATSPHEKAAQYGNEVSKQHGQDRVGYRHGGSKDHFHRRQRLFVSGGQRRREANGERRGEFAGERILRRRDQIHVPCRRRADGIHRWKFLQPEFRQDDRRLGVVAATLPSAQPSRGGRGRREGGLRRICSALPRAASFWRP